MGWQDNAAKQDVHANAPRLTKGQHRVVIHKVIENRGFKGLNFVVEGEILSSTSMEVGTIFGSATRLDGKYPDSAGADVKAFCAAVMGLEPTDKNRVNAEITGAVITGIHSAANPTRGHVVDVTGWIKDESEPEPFVKLRWSPVLENGLPKKIAIAAQAAPTYAQSAPAPTAAAAPPPLPPLPGAVFPPAGWTQHPGSAAHYYKGTDVVTEPQLRVLMAQGSA